MADADAARAKLEAAIQTYVDEMDDDAEFVIDWLLVIATTPVVDNGGTSYIFRSPMGTPRHHSIGLAQMQLNYATQKDQGPA